MLIKERNTSYMLWFDVEKRYKTISSTVGKLNDMLWFDVEKRYKTIVRDTGQRTDSCGLM